MGGGVERERLTVELCDQIRKMQRLDEGEMSSISCEENLLLVVNYSNSKLAIVNIQNLHPNPS